MSLDWYPGIRECCLYWQDAAMLQQTFEALDKAFVDDNDACIDSAKAMVEVVCRAIVEELDNPAASVKPKEESPPFGAWVSAAVKALKLGDDRRQSAFNRLVSQHHKLTETLGALRNEAGPVSHGKEAFVERLSAYHRRAAVLSADAIVAFLHAAFIEAEVKLRQTRQPYERFAKLHPSIDRWASMDLDRSEDGQHYLVVTMGTAQSGEQFTVALDASQVLFHLDRPAYVEALKQGQELDAQMDSAFDVIDPPPGEVDADAAQ